MIKSLLLISVTQSGCQAGTLMFSVLLDTFLSADRQALRVMLREKAISTKRVTYDFHRQMEGATLLKCSEFGDEIVKNM